MATLRRRQHLRPQVGEVRAGSCLGRDDVVHHDARDGQPEHCAGHGHPVVGVGVEDAAVQGPRVGSPAPSALSTTSPPSPVISVASAASRSVSWPRRWAMPRSRDGASASAARAARTRRQLADVAQVDVDARAAGPRRVTVSPPCRSVDVGRPSARAGRAARRRPASCRRASRGTVTRPPVTSAAARNGAALDRSGSTSDSRAAMHAGGDPPDVGLGRRRPRPASRSTSTVISMCGRDGTGCARRGAPRRPRVRRAPASSSPETNCEEPEASMVTGAAGHDPVPLHRERQRPSSVDVGAEGAQRVEHRGHRALAGVRVAVEGHRAVGERGDRRQEPHDGAGQARVDRRRPRSGPGCTQPVGRSCVASIVDAEGAQRAGHQQRVAAAQRAATSGRPVGERGEDQCPVGHRLGPGQRDGGVDRPVGGRCGPHWRHD